MRESPLAGRRYGTSGVVTRNLGGAPPRIHNNKEESKVETNKVPEKHTLEPDDTFEVPKDKWAEEADWILVENSVH